MGRLPRLHVAGGCYHVTLRGNHRQRIFFRRSDYALLESLVAELLEKCRVRLHAYCWMPNHIHLLVQISDVPLGVLMRRISSRYARTIQARVATTGHLFERRYYTILVDTDSYFLELLRYIHLNPVRSGIVGHPTEYAWSSHFDYLGQRVTPWLTTQFGLAMFHRSTREATDRYRAFVEEGVGVAVPSPLTAVNSCDPRILGDDDFLASVLKESWQPRLRETLEDLIGEASRRFSVDRELILSPATQRNLTRARAWIGYKAVKGRVASLAAVARALGRSESSLRESVARHFPVR